MLTAGRLLSPRTLGGVPQGTTAIEARPGWSGAVSRVNTEAGPVTDRVCILCVVGGGTPIGSSNIGGLVGVECKAVDHQFRLKVRLCAGRDAILWSPCPPVGRALSRYVAPRPGGDDVADKFGVLPTT